MPESTLDGVGARFGTLTLRISPQLEFGRKLWVWVHRTIGLFLGAPFVVIGLTGSILAFWQPIDEWLNAAIMRVEVPSQRTCRPLNEIFAASKAGAPPGAIAERLRMPRHLARLRRSCSGHDRSFHPLWVGNSGEGLIGDSHGPVALGKSRYDPSLWLTMAR